MHMLQKQYQYLCQSAYLSSSMDKKLRPTSAFKGTSYLVERFFAALSLIGNAFAVSLLNRENMFSTVDFTVSCIFKYCICCLRCRSQKHVTLELNVNQI